ncbi:TPA: hypothetical protein MHP96_03515 [Klebsiella quasipneumoniae subsp. similipneumoniae]|nr:hypothetical protein [Klebsiella pneumoniae]ROG75389.1 hypothetical protein C4Y52_007145 [Klebsiella pneumoniae subsp. pneumoniae]HBW8921228.1 hypothetical protein [Klebsiella pneumoniae subsp. pneumoniae 1158]HBX1656875.1 hypothetical protein [Klebsiella quasipneumoniae subsp. similipneumoniae]MBL1505475.1 hypothetical protein [Klebsiella pneumoniae]
MLCHRFTSGLTGCCVNKGGQAHRADLTTSRIDDDSREPEIRKATQSAAFKWCLPLLSEAPY